jgi:membrane associated rhomboid family serine protease
MSRFSEAAQSVPLCTLCIVILCCSIHAAFFLFAPPESLGNFTAQVRNVLYLGEWYRVVTAAFFHVGIMHIG